MEIQLAKDPNEPEKQEATRREPVTATLIPCLLAWLLPGAGHFYLGRRRRAVFFLVVVLTTYALGLAMDGRAYVIDTSRLVSLTNLATLANLGLGPLELFEREKTFDRLVWFLPRGPEGHGLMTRLRDRIRSPLNEYGTTYLLTACLMNILLVLDAFDVAKGRKGLPEPEEEEGA